jgi:hypothetical protein
MDSNRTVNNNSQFKICTNNGGTVSFYLKPCELIDSCIFGYYSKILGIQKVVCYKDIKEIKIYAEFPSVTKIK